MYKLLSTDGRTDDRLIVISLEPCRAEIKLILQILRFMFEIHLICRLSCLTVSLLLSHWYPGSGVVLDCIDS